MTFLRPLGISSIMVTVLFVKTDLAKRTTVNPITLNSKKRKKVID
jgi:hypothetical protein